VFPILRAARDRRARQACLLTATAALTIATAGCDPAGASTAAVDDIPPAYLALYRSAPACPGVDWALLAAIGKIESDHGRSRLPGVHSGRNAAKAAGPMQFIPSTWRTVRARHPEIGPDIYNPVNAIPAAARLLCDSGASKDLYSAVYAYNHSNTYVRDVLRQARAYR
jgi:membrane-bound lytic murein transglycosylase B